MNDIHLLRVGVSHPCHRATMDDMDDMSFALGRACESCHHCKRRPMTRGTAPRGGAMHMMAYPGVDPRASLDVRPRTPVDPAYQNIRE